MTRVQKGHHHLNVTVNGKGAIAELLRKVLDMGYTQQLNEALSNEHCLHKPFHPDWAFNTKYIFLPLLGMLLLQVNCQLLFWITLYYKGFLQFCCATACAFLHSRTYVPTPGQSAHYPSLQQIAVCPGEYEPNEGCR